MSRQKQISIKDNQIKKLTDTLHAQAIHIPTLLTQKALEAPGEIEEVLEVLVSPAVILPHNEIN